MTSQITIAPTSTIPLAILTHKTCAGCHLDLPISEFTRSSKNKTGYQSYCRRCKVLSARAHKAERAAWYQAHKEELNEWSAAYAKLPETKIRKAAYNAVDRALKAGTITKDDTCKRCGCTDERLESHHRSYEKEHQLDVIWLCPKCHGELHAHINRMNRQLAAQQAAVVAAA